MAQPTSVTSELRKRVSTAGGVHVVGQDVVSDDESFAPQVDTTAKTTAAAVKAEDDKTAEITYGKTPDGKTFIVPETHSFIHHLFSPFTPKSHLDLLTLTLLSSQCILFLVLPSKVSTYLFFSLFVVFRTSYNFGLAYILRKQSTKKYIVNTVKRTGILDIKKRPAWAKWCKKELEGKVGGGYSFEETPVEFTVWLLFRQVVDVILLNDFTSYSLFAWSLCSFPSNQSIPTHILRWVGGWTLIAFNIWVKVDAHRVVKDYAWYWGDAFYLIVLKKDLVFDGVYDLAPHPMYSVGYIGYYGLSIVVASYPVLFVSLAAHAAQFAFLLWFENPHIERVYGTKKPLAARVPLVAQGIKKIGSEETFVEEDSNEMENPGITEGETGSETEDLSDSVIRTTPTLASSKQVEEEIPHSVASATRSGSFASSASVSGVMRRDRAKSVSAHDLYNTFFRKDVVVMSRIDLLRATDFSLVVLISYTLIPTLLGQLSPKTMLTGYFLNALVWRLFHSFGLGFLLKAQSDSKWLVRHFNKHYHYGTTGAEGAVEEAFRNWKSIYNLSLCMTYISFAGLAWKTYHIPSDWTVGGQVLRHTLGAILVALHVWSAVETYEVLGDFGWLYADFFLLGNYPASLAYTGIYRFLNNPERSMGSAAFFGLALISGSKLVFALAIISTLCHWWFLSNVESPHMQKLYGTAVRKDGGLTKTLKNVAAQNAKHIQPELKSIVQELKGTIEKVDQKVQEVVEEFLESARPKFSEVIDDTKILLQQSRERLLITRVTNVSDLDTSQYALDIAGTSSGAYKFRLGQPIKINWSAPKNHSRKDWIGLYRLGAPKSQLVTRISSTGKWAPLYDNEWDGDEYTGAVAGEVASNLTSGQVVLKGNAIPWQAGKYELRLHHDGKHNVMARLAPIEIYMEQPVQPLTYETVYPVLNELVDFALDSDPKLVPRPIDDSSTEHLGSDELRSDPDDFVIMDVSQAKHIAAAVKEIFDLDFAVEVILADPNLGDLTKRILDTKRILAPNGSVD